MKIKISGYILLAAVIVVSVTTWQTKDTKAPAKDLSEALAEWWENPDIEQAPCLTENLETRSLVNLKEELVTFRFSEDCNYDLPKYKHIKEKKTLFLEFFQPGLTSKKQFSDTYISHLSQKEQSNTESVNRITVKLESLNNPEFISRIISMKKSNASKVFNDESFMVLEEVRYSSRWYYLLPVDNENIIIGCQRRCEIMGTYKSKFIYKVSIPEEQKLNWQFYDNLSKKIFNMALVK